MEILYLLIPIAMVLVAVAIATFVWAVNNRQYDDLDSAAQSILFDDDEKMVPDDARQSSNDQGNGQPPSNV